MADVDYVGVRVAESAGFDVFDDGVDYFCVSRNLHDEDWIRTIREAVS